MSNEILVIVGAHQNNPQKLSHCIDFITSIRKEGLHVCFSTHSNYGIDKIAEICNYVSFDSNNLFIDEYSLINNCTNFENNEISQRWSNWYGIDGVGAFKSFHSSAPHARSALSIIKNGTLLSHNLGYKWSVYIEYDFTNPLIPFSELFENKIRNLESLNKSSLLLMRRNEGFISGGFAIYRSDVPLKNSKFISNWESSQEEWFKVYKNGFFEEVVEEILTEDEDSVMYEDEEDFFVTYWGNRSKIGLFTVSKDLYPDPVLSRYRAIEWLKYSFFPYKEGEEYGFILAAYNWSDKVSFKVTESKARVGKEVIEIPAEMEFNPGGWRTFHSGYIGNMGGTEGSLYLEFKVQSDLDDYKHHIVQEVPLSSIDKFWMLRRFERDEPR